MPPCFPLSSDHTCLVSSLQNINPFIIITAFAANGEGRLFSPITIIRHQWKSRHCTKSKGNTFMCALQKKCFRVLCILHCLQFWKLSPSSKITDTVPRSTKLAFCQHRILWVSTISLSLFVLQFSYYSMRWLSYCPFMANFFLNF